jgi:hypothetical protein
LFCAFEDRLNRSRKFDECVLFFAGCDLYTFVQTALIDCPNLTSTSFPHLFKNTKPGLSASWKESLQMCLKKLERNIMVFIARLHYTISIYNALRFKAIPNYKPIKSDFETFPELKAVLAELEFD